MLNIKVKVEKPLLANMKNAIFYGIAFFTLTKILKRNFSKYETIQCEPKICHSGFFPVVPTFLILMLLFPGSPTFLILMLLFPGSPYLFNIDAALAKHILHL